VNLPQPLGNQFVERGRSRLPVDDEQNQGGLINGELDLTVDIFTQVVRVDDADSPGVDELKVSVLVMQQILDPVPGDAGGRIDDRHEFSGLPVHDRTFPDIRASDDCNFRNGHDGSRD